jgi:ABC-type transport system substrate-binding protein
VQDAARLLPALARAQPGSLELAQALSRAAQDLTAGEQLAVVVGANYPALQLLQELAAAGVQSWPVRVYIALAPRPAPTLLAMAQGLQQRLQQAGLAVHLEAA